MIVFNKLQLLGYVRFFQNNHTLLLDYSRNRPMLNFCVSAYFQESSETGKCALERKIVHF